MSKPTPEALDSLIAALDESRKLAKVMHDDALTHSARTTTTDMELAYHSESDVASEIMRERRDYVRACFASIEALCFSLKSISVCSLKSMELEDYLLCKEHDVEINGTGEVRTRKRKLSFVPNLRYSFSVFAKQFEIEDRCAYGENGFAELRVSLRVRDRLMHPKTLNDLYVSVDELVAMANAYAWFSNQFSDVTTRGFDKLVEHLKGLQTAQ